MSIIGESQIRSGTFNEADHPRAPAGTSEGGQWVSEGGNSVSSGQSTMMSDLMYNGESTSKRASWKRKVVAALSKKLSADPAFKGMSKDAVEGFIKKRIDLWASYGGENSGVVAMQMAAKEEFGLKDVSEGHYWKGAVESAREIYSKDGKKDRALLRAMYDNTQSYFKERGIKELYLVRAVTGMPNKLGGKEFDLGTGMKMSGTVANVKLSALSSYSTTMDRVESYGLGGESLNNNFGFIQKKNGRTYFAKVPVKDILSTPFTGMGHMWNHEVVVLGGTHKQVAVSVRRGRSADKKKWESGPLAKDVEKFSGTGKNLVPKMMKKVLEGISRKKSLWLDLDISATLEDDADELESNADWAKDKKDTFEALGIKSFPVVRRMLADGEGENESGLPFPSFSESLKSIFREWNEADHPRAPAGTSEGGQFTDGGGGTGNAFEGLSLDATPKQMKDWIKNNQARYDTDPDFRAAVDAFSYFSQGDYQILRSTAVFGMTGEVPAEYKGSEYFLKQLDRKMDPSPIAKYKSFFKGQDLETRGKEGRATNREGAAAMVKQIESSKGIPSPLYRGMVLGLGDADNLERTLSVGSSFDVKGPTSFTADRAVAEKFATGKGPGQGGIGKNAVALTVEVKSGARGVHIGAISPYKQKEVVTSGKFKVTRIDPLRTRVVNGKEVASMHLVIEQTAMWEGK